MALLSQKVENAPELASAAAARDRGTCQPRANDQKSAAMSEPREELRSPRASSGSFSRDASCRRSPQI